MTGRIGSRPGTDRTGQLERIIRLLPGKYADIGRRFLNGKDSSALESNLGKAMPIVCGWPWEEDPSSDRAGRKLEQVVKEYMEAYESDRATTLDRTMV